ncbi:sjoegren syndrome nuclear autoantigen 1 family protein [Besnoitia besnoiti]|uniref:Sjoegren syndrome nuclear autoantigen 1 family protein n=1 Tax=Besnoitia besnoiti TaxID=94643 RepID=A0A2A9LZ66_BESBE|nr:sjoegren syndrome nuclear autoantigen 1 family protein [Besnoitia besnoiti]PFH31708.1 sjoegren syndrome nuclear autoantigen 1 family protein [Besnoitia besnoiti]
MTSTTNSNLHNYNHELVACIDDLRRKREEVNRQLIKEEEDKAKVQKEIIILQERLQKLNESLARKIQARNEYDKTILETEAAYTKAKSAQTLLHVLKRESVHLGRKTAGDPGDVPGTGLSGIGSEFVPGSVPEQRQRRLGGAKSGSGAF